jgi:signal transduction histidine kinase
MDFQDWGDWFGKLKWQLISFKFISFCTIILLVVLFWFSLERILFRIIDATMHLKEMEVIEPSAASEIIIKSQAILYDKTISHFALAVTAVLTSIIAIKGVSYVMKAKQTQEVVKKMQNGDLSSNLKKFLPRK